MAVWPWYGAMVKGVLYEAGEFLSVHEYKNVMRWTDQIAGRAAVKRGTDGQSHVRYDRRASCRERHDASDFDTKTQDKIAKPA